MSFRLRNNGPIWLGEFTALTEAGFSNGCSCRLHGASSIVPDGFNLALHVGDEAEACKRQPQAVCGGVGCGCGKVYYLCPGARQ